jgi:hypothetical protein
MIRLSKIVKEGEEPKRFSNEVKKHFLEIVSTYNKYQEMMDRKSDITEVAETLGGITDAARELAVNEADDWFDAHTVKRNMNELTKLGKSFDQVAVEAKNLDQRLHGLYEDMGHILSRYYKIGEISEEQMKERLGLREDGKLQGGEKDPCWKGYEMIGMKPGKGGSQVPNCVPKNESVIKENILKEDLDALGLLIPALGALIGGGLAQLYPYFTGSPNIYSNIKDWWNSKKDNSEMNKIANRIKNDPDVQEFLKKKNKSGWKEMLKKKLTGSELNYLNKIYRSRFNNESVNEAIGNDKAMLALVDMLSNSMEHYASANEFVNITSKIPGFANYKSELKDVFAKYYKVDARQRNDWNTKEWLKWLKQWPLEESKTNCVDCGKVNEAQYGYKDSTASYIDKHKEEFKAAEKMNKGNEQSFYDSLSTLEEKLGHPKYMIFLSNALRGYKVDMYKDPKIKNQQEAEEALFLLSK